MTSLSLRAYHRQIEEWIDQGLYDQAVLHCRHILNTYSKCVDTYRLLGKALLESQKFGDANDIFQRVLSSLPDDFVSHVGLSIIREDENNLNEAIWHMERAFEIQPSNNAIQGELRRLYGRRDGIEPTKVNLNRSALARMYLKGGLYSQAIAEIRMALAEEPQRPDLEVLLAKAYFETQKFPEAKETANQILAKLPYCYDAIYLLWKISLLDGKQKDAENYLSKLTNLDPYAAYLNPQISSTESVPDTAVILEKLDAALSAVPHSSSQPDWAASLGVQIPTEEEPIEPSLPDWIIDQAETSTEVTKVKEERIEETLFELPETPLESTTSSDIPEWMRAIGWEEGKPEESQAEDIVSVSPFSEEAYVPELEAGEIPDWLKEISPTSETEFPSLEGTPPEAILFLEETPPTEGDSIATWLASLETETVEPNKLETVERVDEEIPQWVAELNNRSHLTTEILPTEETWEGIGVEAPSPDESLGIAEIAPGTLPTKSDLGQKDLPAWLTEELPLSEPEQTPDWLLRSYEDESTFALDEAKISDEDTKPVVIHPKVEISAETSQPIEQTFPTVTDDEAFAWLESLAAKQGAQEALLLSPEDRKEEPPEWIREYLDAQPDLTEAKTPPAETHDIPEASQMPPWAFAEQIAGLESAPTQSEKEQIEELPDWLRTALEKEELESTTIAEAEITPPDWLTSPHEEEWIQEFPFEGVSEIPLGEETKLESIASDTDIASIEPPEIVAGVSAESERPEVGLGELTEHEEAKPELGEAKEFVEPIWIKAEEVEFAFTEGEEVESIYAKADETPVEPEKSYLPEIPPVEAARLALAKGLIDQAIGQYQSLVKQRVGLDQIIQDISNALYQYPMEVRMWVLLGDAYLRKDLLAEALDAYNKAEELLR